MKAPVTRAMQRNPLRPMHPSRLDDKVLRSGSAMAAATTDTVACSP